MQMHPMVTVKKAATVLGLDKEAIRRKLATGEIKGERRRVGSKRKWLIYSGEVEHLLEKQRIPELIEQAQRTTIEGLQDFFNEPSEISLTEASPRSLTAAKAACIQLAQVTDVPYDRRTTQPIQAEHVDQSDVQLPATRFDINALIETLTSEFVRRLADEHQSVLHLQDELAHNARLLRRIPDLENQLKEERADNTGKDLEIQTLHTQISLLNGKLEQWQRPWWKSWFAFVKSLL